MRHLREAMSTISNIETPNITYPMFRSLGPIRAKAIRTMNPSLGFCLGLAGTYERRGNLAEPSLPALTGEICGCSSKNDSSASLLEEYQSVQVYVGYCQ